VLPPPRFSSSVLLGQCSHLLASIHQCCSVSAPISPLHIHQCCSVSAPTSPLQFTSIAQSVLPPPRFNSSVLLGQCSHLPASIHQCCSVSAPISPLHIHQCCLVSAPTSPLQFISVARSVLPPPRFNSSVLLSQCSHLPASIRQCCSVSALTSPLQFISVAQSVLPPPSPLQFISIAQSVLPPPHFNSSVVLRQCSHLPALIHQCCSVSAPTSPLQFVSVAQSCSHRSSAHCIFRLLNYGIYGWNFCCTVNFFPILFSTDFALF